MLPPGRPSHARINESSRVIIHEALLLQESLRAESLLKDGLCLPQGIYLVRPRFLPILIARIPSSAGGLEVLEVLLHCIELRLGTLQHRSHAMHLLLESPVPQAGSRSLRYCSTASSSDWVLFNTAAMPCIFSSTESFFDVFICVSVVVSSISTFLLAMSCSYSFWSVSSVTLQSASC